MPSRSLVLLLVACGGSNDPGFAGGGSQIEEREDTGTPGLQDVEGPGDFEASDVLVSCMERGEVGVENGDEPPEVEGGYSVAGEAVASDSWPVGTTIESSMCLWDQADDGTIGMIEYGNDFDSVAEQAWITGEDSAFTVWMELISEDSWDSGCVLQSLGVMTGSVNDDGDLDLRTAAVPVGIEGCDSHYDSFVGACWATAITSTPNGECEGP